MMVYNAEKYLRFAVDSVMRQTFSNWELLIVDDASTDSSPEILSSYTDSRIRVIRNPLNRGVASSRQLALELASGEYVAILDSDDVSSKKRLQVQVDYLDQHPQIDLLGSAYQMIDQAGRIVKTINVPTDPLAIRWTLLFGNCIGHSTVMFRRGCALQLDGYDKSVTAGEDFDLWVRMATHGRIAQLNLPLTQWRSHSASLQRVEPIAVKDLFIWTAIRSVKAQTGIDADFDVVRSLFREIPKPAPSREVLRKAYATIADCLNRFLAFPNLSKSDQKHLCSLALEDIFLLALRNPGSFRDAWRTAALCVDRRDLPSVVNGRIVKRGLASMWPCWLMNLFIRQPSLKKT